MPNRESCRGMLAAVLPAHLVKYAIEMFDGMRASPNMADIADEAIAELICDDAFRAILENYAVGRNRGPFL